MKIKEMIEFTKEIQDFGGVKALALAIRDEQIEYDLNFKVGGFSHAQRKLAAKSRFLLGIGYSEFFARSNSDEELVACAEKRAMVLAKLGVDSGELYSELQRLYGVTTN